MFGIGLGEIILILLVVFLIAPREIPSVLKKVGQFFKELEKLKREIFSMQSDLDEIINETRKTVKDMEESPLLKVGDAEAVSQNKDEETADDKGKDKSANVKH